MWIPLSIFFILFISSFIVFIFSLMKAGRRADEFEELILKNMILPDLQHNIEKEVKKSKLSYRLANSDKSLSKKCHAEQSEESL
jgi:hypothetical protein